MFCRNKERSFLKRVFNPLEVLLIIGIVVIFLEVIMEVISRYVLHVSIESGAEVSQTLLVWITFIGSAVAMLDNEHMAINILLDKISSYKTRKIVEIIGYIAILGFLAAGLIGGSQLALKTWNLKTTVLQIPAGVLYLSFPLGCFFMLPIVIRNIFKKFDQE